MPSVTGAQSELAKVSWAGGALQTAQGVIPFPPTHSPAALLGLDKKGDCFLCLKPCSCSDVFALLLREGEKLQMKSEPPAKPTLVAV